MPLIAFTGPAGSGKSAAARVLTNRGWVLVKFASPLKRMLRTLYLDAGLSEEEAHERIEGSLKEAADPILLNATPRHAMQTLGTEWGRACIGEDIWVHLWSHRIGKLLAEGHNVVCDDCRFANEAEAVRALGGKVVRITGRGGTEGDHPSEAGGVKADFRIKNIRGLADLQDAIRSFFA